MDKLARQQLLADIEASREGAVSLLKQLISFPSVTGSEKDIQAFLAEKLRRLGATVDVWEPNLDRLRQHPAFVPVEVGYHDRPNVVGTFPGSGGGRSLLLNGHVDVTPPGPPEAWTHGPWAGCIEGGRVYGRGASDMKSGLAAMILAMEHLLRAEGALRGDVILEFTVDEELSGHGTLDCVLRGYRADAGISCETSSLCVQPASIGRIWFEILIRGKPAGIQRRHEGVNAIELGYQIFQAVAEVEKRRVATVRHSLYPNPITALPCMIGTFEAGSYPSAFPDACRLRGSIATLPGERSAAVKEQFESAVLAAAARDPWMRDHPPQVRFVGYFAEPAAIPDDHPIVLTVARAFAEVTGRNAEISGREGAADSRLLITYADTPTVIFGPGRTEQMHATEEWVAVEDLVTATKVLALSILDWCG